MPIATRRSATPPTIGARSAKSGRARRCSWTRPAPTAPNSSISTIISAATRPGPVGGYYYNRDLIGGYVDAGKFFKSLNDFWRNVNGATATNRWVPLRERNGVVAGTDFLPSEIQEVSERNIAAYAMLSFGSEEPIFGDVRLSGNIGVRYVNTRAGIRSARSPSPAPRRSASTSPSPSAAPPTPPPPPARAGTPPSMPGGVCRLGEAGL